MTKKILVATLAACLMLVSPTVRAAFPDDDLLILAPKEVTALSDDKLVDSYIDVLAEIEASRAFHTTSGFTPKEYKKYKDLIRYRLRLLLEINQRKLELPAALN